MKLKATIGGCLLVLASWVGAEVLDTSPQAYQVLDTQDTMTWPLYPRESLRDLAHSFYPGNRRMQQVFVLKTLRLNRDTYPQLQPDDRYNILTPLQLPTLKSLSATHGIRDAKHRAKSSLQMSMDLPVVREKVTINLVRDYENLFARNEFLKAELQKLYERLEQLKQKIMELKLRLDKTLHFPPPQPSNTSKKSAEQVAVTAPSTPQTPEPAMIPAAKTAQTAPAGKLKNLDKIASKPAPELSPEINPPWRNPLLWGGLLLVLGAWLANNWLKKYRQRLHQNLFTPSDENTKAETAGFDKTWQDTQMLDVGAPLGKETGITVQEVATDREQYIATTLEEAKLLVSVGRNDDAIAYIKETIKNHPKASIHHWLYLLGLFRKLNMQEEFENYAKSLHQTFNVMTPTWEEREVPMVVPQSLEEFPHIMEKLYASWPSDLARNYLRSLITDNRNGERGGFGKAVLDEILMLIALIDTRKEIL